MIDFINRHTFLFSLMVIFAIFVIGDTIRGIFRWGCAVAILVALIRAGAPMSEITQKIEDLRPRR